MIRVVVADDHHLVRQGIRALLERADDIQIVAEAPDGNEAVQLVEQLTPSVLVIDISMPRLNGIQALEQLRARNLTTQVVILTMHFDETLIRQALQGGARAYVLKDAFVDELLVAIRAADRGETYLGPAIADVLVNDFLSAKPITTPFEQLSPREREVLKLVAEGHTNSEIGQMLSITVKTVEKHRANLMTTLNVHDLAGLIRIAIKHGLIFLDE